MDRNGGHESAQSKIAAPKAPLRVPKPPPPAGYEHEFVIGLNHLVVPWITPVCLVLVLFLWFSPWVGLYPGGYGVYTQNPSHACVGCYSGFRVGEKLLHMNGKINKTLSAKWFLMP